MPKWQLQICPHCHFVSAEKPNTQWQHLPLAEGIIILESAENEMNIAYQKVLSQQLLTFLKKTLSSELESIESVVDLRALSGFGLQSLRDNQIGKSHSGYDFFEKNVRWAKQQYDIPVQQWPEAMEVPLDAADLYLASESILELCPDLPGFLKKLKQAIGQDGYCVFQERDLSTYPQELFLHELFPPWSNHFFTKDQLELLLNNHGFQVIASQQENHRIAIVVKTSEEESAIEVTPGTNPYGGFPRYENVQFKPQWQHQLGLYQGRALSALSRASGMLGNHWDVTIKQHVSLPQYHKKSVCYQSVEQKYLDVIFVSCGRTLSLQKTLAHFQKLVHLEGRKMRLLIHDDFMEGQEKKHETCRQFIKSCGMFDKMVFAEKNKGIGESIKALLSMVETDYYFHLEDDFLFLGNFQVDPILRLFDDFQKINYIRLYLKSIAPQFHAVNKCFGDMGGQQYLFHDQVLTSVPFWSHSANLSRTDSPFVKLILSLSGRFRERMENMHLYRNCTQVLDSYEQVGSFVYGPLYQAKLVHHFTGEKSMRESMLRFFPDDMTKAVDNFR